MKPWLTLMLVLVTLPMATGCGDNTADNTRTVEQHQSTDPYLRNVDEARRTEATTASHAIWQRVRISAISVQAKGGDMKSFYSSLNGQLNATKLAKIGITEAELRGTHYVATDYKISCYGKKMTVEAVKPNTKGYVSQEYDIP
ncbi:MAG: hypothetical protein IPK87_16390 [Planctomycetes bacterium]|nr:hypothetical protein [Planctomycetota bacterium]